MSWRRKLASPKEPLQVYPSKEMLFLDVMEQWYQCIYNRTDAVLAQNAEQPPRSRAAMMLKAAWRIMRDQPLVRFCRDEIPLLLRKLSEPMRQEHYQSVDELF